MYFMRSKTAQEEMIGGVGEGGGARAIFRVGRPEYASHPNNYSTNFACKERV